MRLARLLAAALLAGLGAARADDTDEFLKPENWEGRNDKVVQFKVDPKARTIVGETTEDPKYNTFFCTKAKYSDFELSCKVKLYDGTGNSGFQIRSERFDKDEKQPFRVRGPQVDIGKGYWGSLYGEGVGGMMKASDPKKIEKAVREAEVNEYRIVAKGKHITVVVNGETMVDDDFPTLPGKKDKDGKEAPGAAAPTEGIIALQVHAGYPKMKIEVTDVKFTDLGKRK